MKKLFMMREMDWIQSAWHSRTCMWILLLPFFFRSAIFWVFIEQNLCALFTISGTFSLIIVHLYITISATIVAQLMILDASKANRLQCSEDQLAGSCLLSNLDHFNSAFVVQWYWSHVLNYILYHSFQSTSINLICG